MSDGQSKPHLPDSAGSAKWADAIPLVVARRDPKYSEHASSSWSIWVRIVAARRLIMLSHRYDVKSLLEIVECRIDHRKFAPER